MIRKQIGPISAWMLGIASFIACTSSAKAEFFEFTSKVTIENTPGTYTPSSANVTNAPDGSSASFTTLNGNQVVLNALSSNPAVPHNNALGLGTDIVPMDVNANASFASETIGLNFNLVLTITDYAGALDANPTAGINPVSFSFIGRIGGQLGDFQTNLSLLSFVPTQASGQVGEAQYRIDLNNFASPGIDSNGRLSLHVTARAVPEPG